MHGFKHQKMAFVYVSQITVRVQAIEDPHNQIIVRVRSDLRILTGSTSVQPSTASVPITVLLYMYSGPLIALRF